MTNIVPKIGVSPLGGGRRLVNDVPVESTETTVSARRAGNRVGGDRGTAIVERHGVHLGGAPSARTFFVAALEPAANNETAPLAAVAMDGTFDDTVWWLLQFTSHFPNRG